MSGGHEGDCFSSFGGQARMETENTFITLSVMKSEVLQLAQLVRSGVVEEWTQWQQEHIGQIENWLSN